MMTETLGDLIDGFLDEWINTLRAYGEAAREMDFARIAKDMVILRELESWNFVNRKGYRYLCRAANVLLRKEKLDLQVTEATARDAIESGLAAQIPKLEAGKDISIPAIITHATARVRSSKRKNGIYVIAARVGHAAKKSDFRIGSVRILAKRPFLREYAKNLRKEWPGKADTHRFLLKKWIAYLKDYDHVLLVEMSGFEEEMAWKMARECAEFALNLLRIVFRFPHASRVRLAGDFNPSLRSSSAIISDDGYVSLSSGWASRDSTLDDRWPEVFDREVGPFWWTLGSYAMWLASGTHSGNPVTERLRYAHMLVAEAYCEPSDYLRLVRLTSALEALALLERDDKAHELAVRCACAGGWGDPERANKIYDRTKAAYYWRNAIVHGDAPPQGEVIRAFSALEEHLLEIVVGFMVLFSRIALAAKPQSIRRLRRELKERIDLFFWAPAG